MSMESTHNDLSSAELSSCDMELEPEEFVLADIVESSPFGYIKSLFKSWSKDGVPPLSKQGVGTTDHSATGVSPSLKTSGHTTCRNYHLSWAAICSIILMKILLLFATPVEIFGNILEYILNLFYMNNGLRAFFVTLFFDLGSLKTPRVGQSNYYSAIMLIDPRAELRVPDGVLTERKMLESDVGIKTMADVCVMAAKFAYENENVIRKTVEETWKMNFIQFYDCWNDYLKINGTQAFVFTDKKQDANIVVVAFRGTQPFNMYDWCTDFDFSYYVLPNVGRVHVGFLEALGLGNRTNRETLNLTKANAVMKANRVISHSVPTSGLSSSKVLAYDAICTKARDLLKENPRAKLYVTGHSLGAALATLFTALLQIEENDLCPRHEATFTFGQPRVGDLKFANYVENKLCGRSMTPRKYFRVVYRTDVVPRVPWDDVVFQFKHVSPCHYYKSIFNSLALVEEPYKNLSSLIVQPWPHVSALWELCVSLFNKAFRGSKETDLAIITRFVAVIFPGLCAHNPACYVDAVRLAPSSFLLQPIDNEKMGAIAYLLWSYFRLITFQRPIFL
ncbi:hypothetical protein GOP47_0016494 [Adiantum capillus-veneris]|uniref:Fungal lipase-type domain-containing protein n=1 Tax=Adiantum capillus-veneris TaxID=13818 RepID=A0A9D4UHS6_ADICA|nr:hypothetical protein GOP47_0016494 [Adiantum capillus-veneris]